MDQLKGQLAGVAKHGFWIAVGLMLVGSLGVWWVSTGQLAEEADARMQDLDSQYQAMQGIQQASASHPNSLSHEQMEQMIDVAQQEVHEAWESQYERQEQALKWPEGFTDDFYEAFEPLRPIEAKVEFPNEEEVSTALRTQYKLYIEKQLPVLASIVGAKWTADFTSTRGRGGSGYEASGYDDGYDGMDSSEGPGSGYGRRGRRDRQEEAQPLVQWSQESQRSLLQQMFPWRAKEYPSTLDVLYSQEDLWVVEQLLNIIAEVNGDARQPFQATIRAIDGIKIGRAAVGKAGRVTGTGRRGGTGEGMMYEGSEYAGGYGEEYYGESMEGGEPTGPGGSAGGAQRKEVDPAENRYVDNAYQPIEAERVRSAFQSNSPEDAYLAVAKRIPVRLNVKMDQRRIHRLIAACGNANLMVEVRQVRINPSDTRRSGGSSYGGGYGGAPGGGYDSGGYESSYGESSGSSYGGRERPEYPYDLPVELYGVVYMYNPPDIEKLGIEQVTEETRIDADGRSGDRASGRAEAGEPDPETAEDDAPAAPDDARQPADAPAEDPDTAADQDADAGPDPEAAGTAPADPDDEADDAAPQPAAPAPAGDAADDS